MLQPWDTMSLRTADLGSVCVASGPMWVNSKHLNRATLLSSLHELLHWRAKRDPKVKMLFLQSFLRKACRWAMLGELKPKGPKGSTFLASQGRVVGLCWEHLKPKGPKERKKKDFVVAS